MKKLLDVQEIMDKILGKEGDVELTESEKDGYILTLQDMLQIERKKREDESFEYLLLNWNVAYYREINSSKAVKFIKRILRKLMKFCVVPILEDQNSINANVLQLLNVQKDKIAELEREIVLLKKTMVDSNDG